MPDHMYSAWFRDSNLAADDQDHEWVAMFLMTAETAERAHAWGDRSAMQFAARRTNETFIRSYLEDPTVYQHCSGDVPQVQDGEDVSDYYIGW